MNGFTDNMTETAAAAPDGAAMTDSDPAELHPAATGDAPLYRKLTAADTDQLAAHLKRLEPHDRYLRFSGGLTDMAIDDYCARLDWSAAIVVGAFVDGELRGVGELVRVRVVPRILAEVAFSVEGPWQNAGVGTELLRRVLTVARNRCIDRVFMMCLADNKKMQKVARKFEAVLSFEEGEVEARILPAWPSYFSLMEEAVEDGKALFPSIFEPLVFDPKMFDPTALWADMMPPFAPGGTPPAA